LAHAYGVHLLRILGRAILPVDGVLHPGELRRRARVPALVRRASPEALPGRPDHRRPHIARRVQVRELRGSLLGRYRERIRRRRGTWCCRWVSRFIRSTPLPTSSTVIAALSGPPATSSSSRPTYRSSLSWSPARLSAFARSKKTWRDSAAPTEPVGSASASR